MVHTFELSKVISEEMFEILIKSLKCVKYNKIAWYTKAYADKGIPMVCLYKFKPKRKNEKGEWTVSETEPYMYMAILSVNTGIMFGGDGYTTWKRLRGNVKEIFRLMEKWLNKAICEDGQFCLSSFFCPVLLFKSGNKVGRYSVIFILFFRKVGMKKYQLIPLFKEDEI